jgi:chemotaxis protein methyltransferase CheR
LKKKAVAIPSSLLEEAGKIVSRHTGLCFQEGRRDEMERGLLSAMGELGFEDPASGIRWLICSTPTESQIGVFASHLTVGETYFFRDKKCFDFLEGQVLPELIDLRRRTDRYLRIWSAGCCTGEEAYSIAILLAACIPDMKDWNITVLGTDVNPLFVKKASAGIYGEWSFRDTPTWVRKRFFARTGNSRFELLPEIRKRVTFACHNLVDSRRKLPPGATGAMDLVLCRNVLMYLGPEYQEYVIRRLKSCLAKGGWLIVGASETSDGMFSEFEVVNFQGAAYYRNSRRETGATVPLFRTDGLFALPGPADMTGRFTESRSPAPEGTAPPGMAFAVEERTPGKELSDPYKEGLFFSERGLYAEAVEKLTPLLLQKALAGKAAALLARVFANQGRLSEAMNMCDRAISAEKAEPAGYYLRAVIFQEQGKQEESAADLRTALYLDQDFVPAHLLLGNLALRQGKKGESARHFRNAFDLLRRRLPDEVIPGMEGLTAGRIVEMIRSAGFEDLA